MLQIKLDLELLRTNFETAHPFRHLILDGAFSGLNTVAEEFPTREWAHWGALDSGDTYQPNKLNCSERSRLPVNIGSFIDYLNSAEFLSVLEKLTGISGLMGDPYLAGGGLHLSLAGGVLLPHTDFHVYTKLNLYRRLNLLVYLNSNWVDGDGGELEIAHSAAPELTTTIKPKFGRTIIFETNDKSVHGFRNPVRSGTTRRSIAIYYYTANETEVFGGDYLTHWRDHGRQHRSFRASLRRYVHSILLQLSRTFSMAAFLVHPQRRLSITRRLIRRLRQKQIDRNFEHEVPKEK